MQTKENLINISKVEDFELAVLFKKQSNKQEEMLKSKWLHKAWMAKFS